MRSGVNGWAVTRASNGFKASLIAFITAPGAVMNAINDALQPYAVRVTAQPFTPERILKALGRV
jgi:hypothetical protein